MQVKEKVYYNTAQTYITQGTNARKVISEGCEFFVLSLGGKVNTRRMSQPDMESIFTKTIYEIFWS